MNPLTELLTVADVARLSGRDYRKILRAIRLGELTAFDITDSGSRRPEYRVHPDHYTAWLRSKMVVSLHPVAVEQVESVDRSRRAANAAYRDAA